MRALCGAIITAGALIGLGMTAMGIGNRYSYFSNWRDPEGNILWLRLKDLDTPLMLILVVLLASVVIGMTISFLGLMYHHYRRHHEHLLSHRGTVTHGEDRPRISV